MADKNGYLLIEALLAISVLAVGLYASTEAFSLTRDALSNSAQRSRLSICAQEKFIDETIGLHLDSGMCDTNVNWRAEKTLLSPTLQKTLWHASWGGDQSREETVEIVGASR